MLHTWSLAVEEQYYILAPPVLWLAWSLGRYKAVLGVVIFVIVISLVIAELGTTYAATANYYLLPSRAWELMLGALATLLWPQGKRVRESLRDLLGWFGLGLIIISVIFVSEDTPFPSIWTVPSTLGAVLILVSAGPNTWIGRLLNLKVFIFFGLISYSLYLWHQPLLALYRVYAGDSANGFGLALMVLASVVMGWVSWRFVERPFRSRIYLTQKKVFTVAAAGLACIALTGVIFVKTSGAIERYPKYLQNILAVPLADRGKYVRDRYTREVHNRPFSGDQPQVLLIGDSFSQDFYNVISESGAFTGYQISADYIEARCQFHLDGILPEGAIEERDLGRCAMSDNRINDSTIARASKADIIILAFFWRDWAIEQLPVTLKALGLQPDTEIILVGSKYFSTPSMQELQEMAVIDLLDFRAPLDPVTLAVNSALSTVPVRAEFVDITAEVCDTNDACRVFTPEASMISYDKRHLTQEGARYIGKLLFSASGPLARFGRDNQNMSVSHE